MEPLTVGEASLVESDGIDVLSPVVVFESCLDVIISVIVYILTLVKVLSTMN